MNTNLLPLLKCPSCGDGGMQVHVMKWHKAGEADDAIVHCRKCKSWYPVEQGVLELLTAPLWYIDDRNRFFEKYKAEFDKLQLTLPIEITKGTEGYEAQAL